MIKTARRYLAIVNILQLPGLLKMFAIAYAGRAETNINELERTDAGGCLAVSGYTSAAGWLLRTRISHPTDKTPYSPSHGVWSPL